MDDVHRRTTAQRSSTATVERRERDLNPDPITGEPGSHPLGTGVGAAAGGAAGAAIGAVAGPVGALVGGAIGAIAGGVGGHAVGERLDPTVEEAYWRESYGNRPYAREGRGFDDYAPAYRYGHEARLRADDRGWDDVEGDLRTGWTEHRGERGLEWDEASPAVRDAFERTGSRLRAADEEDAHWREVYTTRPYYDRDYAWDDYRPAYHYGWEARHRHHDREWDDRLEAELSEGWAATKGRSRLSWEKAKDAVRDAWFRAKGRHEYESATRP